MRELARRVGVQYQSIQHLLDPLRYAKGSKHTYQMARILGVSPTWLATGKGKPTRKAPRVDQRVALLEAMQTAAVLLPQLQQLAASMDEHERNGKAT